MNTSDGQLQDLVALDASVQAAEQHLKQIQAFIQQERQAMLGVQAVHAACASQLDHLQYISSNLPARLPAPSQEPAAQQVTASHPAAVQQHAEQEHEQDENSNAANQQPATVKPQGADKKKKAPAPRR